MKPFFSSSCMNNCFQIIFKKCVVISTNSLEHYFTLQYHCITLVFVKRELAFGTVNLAQFKIIIRYILKIKYDT